jgi:hypothetical protein
MWLRVLMSLAAIALLGVASPPLPPDPVQAVREWYAVIGSGSGSAVDGYGTLGGTEPYSKGYAMLDSTVRATKTLKTFLRDFARTAYIRLDQAELVEANASRASVFVEDERDMDLAGLPATVRYFGRIRLTRNSGLWRIVALELYPEKSIISLRDGGHGSEGYVADVAMVTLAKFFGISPQTSGIESRYLSRTFALVHELGPVTVMYQGPRGRLSIELARLYSGHWAKEHPESRDRAWFLREVTPKLDAFWYT